MSSLERNAERLQTLKFKQTKSRVPLCHYCNAVAKVVCDHIDDGLRCDRLTCGFCARYWEKGKDVCLEHAKQLKIT